MTFPAESGKNFPRADSRISARISEQIRAQLGEPKPTDFLARARSHLTIAWVSTRDLAVLSRKLSALEAAGISTVKSLSVIGLSEENPKMRNAITDVIYLLTRGENVSGAFAAHPEIFSSFFICMLQAGEAGGKMAWAFAQLAEHFEKESRFWKKFQSAMIYPVAVVSVAAAMVIFLCTYIIPSFSEIFSGMSERLPLATRVLMGFTAIVTSAYFWGPVLVLAASAYFFLKHYLSTYVGRLWFDETLYKTPLIGKIWKSVNLMQFSRMFESLSAAGVSFAAIAGLMSQSLPSLSMRMIVHEMRESVERGSTVFEAFRRMNEAFGNFFPKFYLNMVALLRGTSVTQEVFGHLTRYYEVELDTFVERFLSFIEPGIIAVLGVVVSFILIAVFIPIYSLISRFQ